MFGYTPGDVGILGGKDGGLGGTRNTVVVLLGAVMQFESSVSRNIERGTNLGAPVVLVVK